MGDGKGTKGKEPKPVLPPNREERRGSSPGQSKVRRERGDGTGFTRPSIAAVRAANRRRNRAARAARRRNR